MKNKISYSHKIWLFSLGILSALVYGVFVMAKPAENYVNLDIQTQSLKNNSSTIHFNAGGNDFWGGALWISTQKKLNSPQYISTWNWTGKYCSVKIEGLYYNSQRGERLRPLDNNTLISLQKWSNTYNKLRVQGGLYTSCGTGDEYSIYGTVKHDIQGDSTPYFLVAGVNYDIPHNRIQKNSKLNCTLQLVNNKTVVGYLYDYQGGIGFIGGNVPSPEANEKLAQALSGGHCITEIFVPDNEQELHWNENILGTDWVILNENSFQNLKWTLAVRGIVGLTNNIFSDNKTDIEGNFGDKSQTVRTSSVSLADAVNTARKKSEQLCKGKWNKNSWNLRCFDNDWHYSIPVKIEPQAGITYVFKNIDAEFTSYMKKDDKEISVFIDWGKLLLPNLWTGRLIDFDNAWYPVDTTSYNKGNYLKGNFIINGIIQPSSWSGIENKLYVHGKLLTLNTHDTPTEKRKSQISSLLERNFIEKFINYRELFTWRCIDTVNGIASDGTDCGRDSSELARAPLTIIDVNFNSLLNE